MPAIAAGSHVLVTGASGFIAVWCCHQLLERKFKVRATVRSQDKGKYLEQLFQRHADQFSYVICEDLEKVSIQYSTVFHSPAPHSLCLTLFCARSVPSEAARSI